ncbi:MAG TPA: GNAT family N-acetyltransferase [Chitinophagaceae bacterium]
MTNTKETKIVFRQALLNDIPALHVVRMSVKENALSNPDLVKPADYEEFLLRKGRGWLCEVGNEVAGFAIVDIVGNNVWALFLHPDHERKGIGKRLHADMMDWYFVQTTAPIWLSTAPGTRAESFYRKAGWTATGFTKSGEVKFEMTADSWQRRSLCE